MATTVSSNLNVDSIVSALMKPYQEKVTKVNSEISSYQVTLTNLGKLTSSLTSLKTNLETIESNEKVALTPEKLKESLKSFVKEFNSTTAVTRTSKDMSVNRLTQQLRAEIDPVAAREMGLSFDKTGAAVFNEVKFDAMSKDDVTGLNAAVNKVFDKALSTNSSMDRMLKDGGKLDLTEDTYTKKVSELTKKKEKMEDQLGGYETKYRRQYNELQKALIVMDSNQAMMANLLNTTA
jgi:flagellar capping protein FliD